MEVSVSLSPQYTEDKSPAAAHALGPKLNPRAHAFSSHLLSSQSARVLGFLHFDWLLCLSAADWLLQDLALKPQFPVSESRGIWWFSCRRTLRETSASYGMPLSRR